jgi:glycerophosphoryl diester phosphodiesterase
MSDWLRRLPIAHRGLHDAALGVIENSLSSFSAALAAGYAIELDLRLSRDGEAMVYHDATLERLTEGEGPLALHSAAQLAALTLTGSPDRIPALPEVLDLVQGRVPLLLEIKAGEAIAGILESRVAALLTSYRGAVAIQSFDPAVITWFAAHAPAFGRGLLARRTRDLLTRAIFASQFIAYDVTALPALGPMVARRMGLPVIAWTVKDEQSWSIAAAHADNIIFEGIRPPSPRRA